ncbi:MAG TPA: 4Fe-4S dicluster domain-containing protein [Archaeoglobaceae archaeon]|nr:4Fe-4S dicluster domain-containing protein [Archaeoglobaceae archaeon]
MMLELKFDSRIVKEPIISKATLEADTLINIIRANVGARHGEMVIEIDDSKVDRIIEALRSYGVEVAKIDRKVVKSDDCIYCGACVSICPVEVFFIDEEKKVQAESQKCIHCGVCVKVCPISALSLP